MKKLLFLFLALSTFACKTEPQMPENFDYGSIENSVYTNNYFNMRFPFDESWDVQSKDEIQNIMDSGEDIITDDRIKRAIKASEVNTANLFVAYFYELGSVFTYNPSIIIVAENIKMFPQVTRGSDYLVEAKKILKGTSLGYEFEMGTEPKIIDGKSFDIMNVTGNYMGNQFSQKYMSTITKGFSLSFILSYNSDDQLNQLMEAINKMSFTDGKSKKKN
ncbi:hypothetical protein [uncultured Psychroserpens sp.]|uniref:hypothetical protein n=1 Tax=uncultured Psychroserpens sp. TaxID=255436 RepID=UPI0026379BAC|nr:hypothetical protein [uncultured Psychroserpens sp.]